MKDKYSEAVEYLTANPLSILPSWGLKGGKYHYLFRHIANRTFDNADDVPSDCGCLTLICLNHSKYAHKNGNKDIGLTEAIRKDKRIPIYSTNVLTTDLHVFAEWQRRIDHYYETGILDMERDFTVPVEPVKPQEPAKEPVIEYRTIVIDTKVKQLTETKLQLS